MLADQSVCFHVGVLALPSVKRRIAHPVDTAHFPNRACRHLLVQYPNDLLFSKLRSRRSVTRFRLSGRILNFASSSSGGRPLQEAVTDTLVVIEVSPPFGALPYVGKRGPWFPQAAYFSLTVDWPLHFFVE